MPDDLVKVEVKVPGGEVDKAAAEVLARVLGGPADEAGGMLADIVGLAGDRIRAHRYVNKLRIAKKTLKIIENEGLRSDELTPLPLREVPDVIAAISDVDQEELSDLWAGLLADAMNPNNGRSADKHLVAALKSMTEEDALLFSAVTMSSELKSLMVKLAYKATDGEEAQLASGELNVTEWSERVRLRNQNLWAPSLALIERKIESLGGVEGCRMCADNLVSLGLVERGDDLNSSEINSHKFSRLWQERGGIEEAITELARQLQRRDQLIEHWKTQPIHYQKGFLPRFALLLTEKGERLVKACNITLPKDVVAPLVAAVEGKKE